MHLRKDGFKIKSYNKYFYKLNNILNSEQRFYFTTSLFIKHALYLFFFNFIAGTRYIDINCNAYNFY